MCKLILRMVSLIVALCIIFGICAAVNASEVNELKGHWAEETLSEWARLGLLKGDNNGNYNPDSKITRAEFMALVNRVMNYSGKSDDIRKFTDVSSAKWYYNDAEKALAAGYITGTTAATLSPEKTITREQAITIISRIKGVDQNSNMDILSLAGDFSDISGWAKGPVAGAIREGLVTGTNGRINPRADTTRCEAIVLLDRLRTDTRIYYFAGIYGPESGTVTAGNVVIASPGITLRNLIVTGNLEIAKGDGDAILDNVVVHGKLVTNGGKPTVIAAVRNGGDTPNDGTPSGGGPGGGSPGGDTTGGGSTGGDTSGGGPTGGDTSGGGSSGGGSSDPDDQVTHINVLPGVNVEVGEEVYFDGAFYQNEYDPSVQWEWDFGDGYTLKAGAPSASTFDTGLCVVHYFMEPGTYEVKLNVSKFDMTKGPPVRQELFYTDSVAVHVTGEAPMAGFELRHAPFHARTAQYLYAVVPSGYSPDQVSVRLESSKGKMIQQLNGVTEDGKQRFLLENAKLPAGDYVIVAELKNGQETVSTIREKFSKPYDGAPEVGINENNAFVLNGKDLYFPTGPWMLNKDLLPLWKLSSNTLFTYGYYPVRDDAAWKNYVEFAGSNDCKAIGPTGWIGKNERNSNPADLLKYIEAGKDLEGLFGWCWDDEPSLGGRYERIPATVIAAWTSLANRSDPQHPSTQQYYGYDYLPYYDPLNRDDGYSYMRSEYLFGGKKAFTADFITHDIYPIEYKHHPSLTDPDRGVIDLWAESLDNFNRNMDGLIPTGTFVETQDVESWNRNGNYETQWDAGPTPGDLRTQLWTAIVHNMKAVFYFEFFSCTPMDNMSVLNEFREAVTDLTPIILAPPSSHTVTHNCHKRGQRVDLMVRETPTDYYIFAARVTEPESEWNEEPEPETIEFELDTGTQATVAYDVFPAYRWEYQLFDVTQEQTSFQFALNEKIKPGSVLIAAVEEVPDGIPEKVSDRWTGKEYSAALLRQGALINGYDNGEGKVVPLHNWKNIKDGTINYETGELSVEFRNNVPLGEDFIQVAYAVEDRPVRTITGSDGVFKDTLERNAVRIYRVPKV